MIKELIICIYKNKIINPFQKLYKRDEGGKEKINRGANMIKVHFMSVWKITVKLICIIIYAN
jgi:hypothetical protein